MTTCEKHGGWVKKSWNSCDVIYGWPLINISWYLSVLNSLQPQFLFLSGFSSKIFLLTILSTFILNQWPAIRSSPSDIYCSVLCSVLLILYVFYSWITPYIFFITFLFQVFNKRNCVCLGPHGRNENILKKCSYELYSTIN